MKTAMFGLALASFVSMTVSVALAADLAGRYERNYTSRNDAGCSCDAPGIVGLVCATPARMAELAAATGARPSRRELKGERPADIQTAE